LKHVFVFCLSFGRGEEQVTSSAPYNGPSSNNTFSKRKINHSETRETDTFIKLIRSMCSRYVDFKEELLSISCYE